MAVCICAECGARVTTRSAFELDCPECGAEGALVAEDAYDPEPVTLVCVDCGYEVEGGGRRRYDDDEDGEGEVDNAGRFSVDDSCPRCDGVLDPDSRRGRGVREKPEHRLAKGAAQALLRKHGLTGPQIDVAALAEAEGLKVVHGRFPHQGMLIGDMIEVPIDEPLVAQRFLIAHELGHWHLRHRVADDKIEPEANAFASELLVPRADLSAAVKTRPTLAQLRRHFNVSRDVIVYALMDARLMNSVRAAA
jgi:hypothetical protein